MNTPENKKPNLKFGHIFMAAAVLMVLMPAFPFPLLSVLPLSWKPVGQADTHGMIGAGIGTLAAVLPVTVIFAYDMVTGWKGGADIGLGFLYLFLPVFSVVFMDLG